MEPSVSWQVCVSCLQLHITVSHCCCRYHTCAVDNNQTLHCWGAGATCAKTPANITACTAPHDYGQALLSPELEALKWTQVAAGKFHSCGITSAADLRCWGAGTAVTRVYPHYGQSLPPNMKFASVSVGNTHTCAVALDNSVHCFGEDINRGSTGSKVDVPAGMSASTRTGCLSGAMQAETRLESLKLGQLQLDPLFASDTTCYEAWSDDDYLNVSAVQWPSSAEALVYRVDSTTVEAGLLNMTSAMILDQTVTLTVTVLAQDGITEQLYTITLHNNKSAAQDASLATLTLGTHDILRASELAVLEPVFSAEMLQYLVVPPVPVESVYINCSTATRGALVEINGQITTTSSANLALTPGLTRTIQIKVSSPSGATSNYQVSK